MRRLVPVLLFAASVACAPDPADPSPAPSDTPSPIAIDWSALGELEPVRVDDLTLRDCEGDAPLLCIEREGEQLGSIELGLFARAADTDPQTLEALAEDHRSTFAKDRKEGCPAGYTVRFDRLQRVPFAGLDGIRSGFTVRDHDGKLVEHNITYFAINDERLLTLGIEGLAAEGSCLEVLGGFDAATVTELLPLFDRIAAGSVPPEENPL